jgi:hypothetical protein
MKKRGQSGGQQLFKRLGGTGQSGKKGGGPCGRGRVEKEEGRWGPWRSGRQRGAISNAPGRRARAVALSREQRRGRGRARATRCGWLTRGLERDGGPGVSGRVREIAGERGWVVMRHQQAGPSNTVPRRRFKRYFELIQNI